MIAGKIAAQAACALVLCASFTHSTADVASAIGDCRAAVGSEEGWSLNLVADSCPGLIREIESSPWRDTLASGWQQGLTYWELSQFEYFVSYYGQRSAAGGAISLSSLDAIVLELGPDAQDLNDESLWERFIDWIGDLLSDETDNSPGWLSEWLSNFQASTVAIEIVFWVLSALVVAAAVAVIVAEISAARGSLPANKLKSRERRPAAGTGVDSRTLTLADVDKAALDAKPSVLLRLVLQRLEALGLLAYSPARTHREVGSAADKLGNEAAAVISRVSTSAERSRFSSETNQPQEIGEVVSAGIALLDDLKPGQA